MGLRHELNSNYCHTRLPRAHLLADWMLRLHMKQYEPFLYVVCLVGLMKVGNCCSYFTYWVVSFEAAQVVHSYSCFTQIHTVTKTKGVYNHPSSDTQRRVCLVPVHRNTVLLMEITRRSIAAWAGISESFDRNRVLPASTEFGQLKEICLDKCTLILK